MANDNFKENILKLLSSTGYSLNLNTDHLSSLENHNNLKPFLDWLTQNVSVENCISNDELEEFKLIEQGGEAVYDEDLDKALEVFHNRAEDQCTGIPYLESVEEALCDESNFLKNQLNVRERLLSTIRASKSAVIDDMCKLNNEIQLVESRIKEVLKDLYAVNKVFSNKVLEAKIILDELRDLLSGLTDANRDISIDEGIDTFMSDKLDISTFSQLSTTSVRSTSWHKGSNVKFLCQLPFHQYEKQQKQFARVFEKPFSKKAMKLEGPNADLDLELEILVIMDRLFVQKKSYIINKAELEAITATQEKIKKIIHFAQNVTSKEITSKLREELMHLEEQKMKLDDSLTRDDGLNKVCNKWAQLRALSTSCNIVQEKCEHAKQLSAELDEMIAQLKNKVAVDSMLCEILNWEEEKVEESIKVYTRVHTMMAQMVESTKKRLEVMAANAQDYANYCSLPINNRCDLIGCLAGMLGSDLKGVKNAINALDENSKKQHQSFSEYFKQYIQTILSVEQKMKDCYNEDVQERTKPQNGSNLNFYQSIQNTLDEMSVEISNATTRCQLQDNGSVPDEDNELQDVLQKLILHYNNKTNSL